jgi:hypothetical protein
LLCTPLGKPEIRQSTPSIYINILSHIHTHRGYTLHIYIYIYMCVCVCVCYCTVYETKAKAILKRRRFLTKIFLFAVAKKLFLSTDIEGTNTKFVPPNPDIAPLFVHRNSWQLIKCGRESKYSRPGNFCPHTFPMALCRGLAASSLQLLTPAYTITQTEPNAPAALHYTFTFTFTLHC